MSVLQAVAVDLAFGEPPSAVHPTVWMGGWIGAARARHTGQSAGESLSGGAATVLLGAAASACAAWLAERIVRRAPAGDSIRGVLLKPALSLRALLAAGAAVEHALRSNDLVEARRLLAWHLVSRDTRGLGPEEVAGAAIESLAENLGDGFVAPLLAFRVGGLPGAYLYRFLNTADAMIGYRTEELEWFGKVAARADDVASFLPARLTALLLALASPLAGGDPVRSARVVLSESGSTRSPNAGWPMAAAAGALDVRLVKRGEYRLHAGGRDPTSADLRRAIRLVGGAAALATLLAAR